MAIEDLDLEFEDEEERKKSDAIELDVELNFAAGPAKKKKPVAKKAPGKSIAKKPLPKKEPPKPVISADDRTDPTIKIPLDKLKQKEVKPEFSAGPQKEELSNVTDISTARDDKTGEFEMPATKSEESIQTSSGHMREFPVDRPQMTQSVSYQKPVSDAGRVSEEVAQDIASLQEQIDYLQEQIALIQQDADIKVAVEKEKTKFMVQYLSNAKLMEHQVESMLKKIHTKAPALKKEILQLKKYIDDFMKKSA